MLKTISLVLKLKEIILDDSINEIAKIAQVNFFLKTVSVKKLIRAFFIDSLEMDLFFLSQDLRDQNLYRYDYSEINSLSLGEITNKEFSLKIPITRHKNLPLIHSIVLSNHADLLGYFLEKIEYGSSYSQRYSLHKITKAISNFSDPKYGTALNHAVREQKTKIVGELLFYGADPNKIDCHGYMPLWFATAYSYAEICKKLLEYKADIHIEDNQGNNIWHLIAETGNERILDLLLKANNGLLFSINARNISGITALDMALSKNHEKIFEKLFLNITNNSNSENVLDRAIFLETVSIDEVAAPFLRVQISEKENNVKYL